MKIAELITLGTGRLAEAGVDCPQRDAELLLEFSLGKSRTQLLLSHHEELKAELIQQYYYLLARREKREPVAYITREQEFWSLPFLVTPDVLIPRPETEFVLESVFSCLKNIPLPEGRILDLCCGSGIIAVVLARELQRKIVAVDISERALLITRHNSIRNQTADLVAPVRSDLLTGLVPQPRFALIVSNPPYVSASAMEEGLQPEVAWFEPHLALDGGRNGIEVIQRIRRALPDALVPGGQFFMEIGYDQGAMVAELFHETGDDERSFQHVEILQDYAGKDRILHAVLS